MAGEEFRDAYEATLDLAEALKEDAAEGWLEAKDLGGDDFWDTARESAAGGAQRLAATPEVRPLFARRPELAEAVQEALLGTAAHAMIVGYLAAERRTLPDLGGE